MMNERLARWCLEEVIVQRDDIIHVPDLYRAFTYALAAKEQLDQPEVIKRIGAKVKPGMNSRGWRNYPVFMGYGVEGAPWQEIPRLMVELGEALKEGRLTPTEWFIAFEEIHPFGDGNGRTGAVVANILEGRHARPGDEPLKLSYEIHSWQN
jgi:hypothetical protein